MHNALLEKYRIKEEYCDTTIRYDDTVDKKTSLKVIDLKAIEVLIHLKKSQSKAQK